MQGGRTTPPGQGHNLKAWASMALYEENVSCGKIRATGILMKLQPKTRWAESKLDGSSLGAPQPPGGAF